MSVFNDIQASLWWRIVKRCGKSSTFVKDAKTFDESLLKCFTKSKELYSNIIIEHFRNDARNKRLFIAGNIDDHHDIELIAHLANEHRDVRFLVAPQKISEERLNVIRMYFRGNSLLYSECDKDTDFSTTQIFIIDYLGDLAYMYRYGTWVYEGCGNLPDVFEPIPYGLPVAYGLHVNSRIIPQHLVEHKICTLVRTKKEITTWFQMVSENEPLLNRIKKEVETFTIASINFNEHE